MKIPLKYRDDPNLNGQITTLIVSLGSNVLSYSVLATFGLFFVSMVEEFNWSATAGSLGFAVTWLARSIFSPLSGFSYGRFGIRVVTVFGSLILALGLLLSSSMNSQWEYALYFGVIVSAGSTALSMSHSILIPRWFTGNRGFAMGIVSTAYGLGPLVFFPLINALIDSLGWRNTLNVYALALVIFGIIALLTIRNTPPAQSNDSITALDPPQSWALKDALKGKRFWALGTMYIAGFLGYQMLVAHQVAYAEAAGIERGVIVSALSFMGGLTLIGAIIGGSLSDKLGREIVFFSSSVIGALGILSFILLSIYSGNIIFLLGFSLFGGIGFGMRLPLVLTIAADVFQGPLFPKLIGFLGVATAIGGFTGPMLAGIIFDMTSSYLPALIVSATAMLGSGLLVWLVAPTRKGLFSNING